MCSSKLLVREEDKRERERARWGLRGGGVGGGKERGRERDGERENAIWCRNGKDRLSGSFGQETLLIL